MTTPTPDIEAAIAWVATMEKHHNPFDPYDQEFMRVKDAILAALTAKCPDGFVCVPTHATLEMREAAVKQVDGPWDIARFDIHDAADVWIEMIAAARKETP